MTHAPRDWILFHTPDPVLSLAARARYSPKYTLCKYYTVVAFLKCVTVISITTLSSLLIDQIMASRLVGQCFSVLSGYNTQEPLGTHKQSDTRVYLPPLALSFLLSFLFSSLSEVVDRRRVIVDPRGRATLSGETERERGGRERGRERREGREMACAVSLYIYYTSTDHGLRSIL